MTCTVEGYQVTTSTLYKLLQPHSVPSGRAGRGRAEYSTMTILPATVSDQLIVGDQLSASCRDY
jgi:hypothetical protein